MKFLIPNTDSKCAECDARPDLTIEFKTGQRIPICQVHVSRFIVLMDIWQKL